MHLPNGLLLVLRRVASHCPADHPSADRLEQQVEGVPAVLHLEQLHEQAEHNDEHRQPEVHGDTLLSGVELAGDEDGQGHDAEAKKAVCA